MFGFLFGTACLVGLALVIARGRRHGRFRYRFGLGHVLERLDTTPGQEKVIRTALDELHEQAREVRGELKETRRDLAQALRGETLDVALVHDVFRRHDDSLGKLRQGGLGAFGRIHETLDERQRRTLADLIESGPFGWRAYSRAC
ncbi:MAG TPA: periplasmic heavy metal sensor [Polyangiaceae bacterium]|jgi:GAF domain-containing protein